MRYTGPERRATKRGLRYRLGYYRWLIPVLIRQMVQEKIPWWIARHLPRKVALLTFVRVYACTGDAPGPEYGLIYHTWEAQGGVNPTPTED